MRHLLAFVLAGMTLVAAFPAQAQVARGLIVKLKDASGATAVSAREQPRQMRERLSQVAQDSGLPMEVASVSANAVPALIGQGHHLMRFARPMQGEALDAAVRRLRLHPDVAWVEPDVLMKLAQSASPNDPAWLSGKQDHLKDPATYAGGMNIVPAWGRTTGGPVVVAVLDTGVRFDHPDLAGKLLPGYDFVSEVEYANDGNGRDADASDPGDWVSAFDRSSQPALFGTCSQSDSTWHGTFIAGQLSAVTNNLLGVAGINQGNQVLPVRVSGKCGAFLSDILDGMRWAAGLSVDGVPANPNPAKVINLSFGGDVACTRSYQDVIDEVTAAGALVVVAAGNDGGVPRRPADCNNVLAVAAAQPNGQKTSYSNAGPTISIMAPGGSGTSGAVTNIYSSVNLGTTGPGANDYGYKRGTSFSAPMAAGVATLMLSLNPALTPLQLIERIKSSARAHVSLGGSPSCAANAAVVCNCTTATCGAGLLDAGNATFAAASPAARIAAVAAPATGSTLTLDGRNSAAVSGSSITSYQWSQVSGTTVTITNPAGAQASTVLPAAAGSFRFRLVVTDSAGRTGEEFISVTSVVPEPAPSTGGGSGGGGGGGGGSAGWLFGAALWMLAVLARRQKMSSSRT